MIKIKIKNAGEITQKIKEIINAALVDVADVISENADDNLRRDYKMGGAFDTGNLARSQSVDRETFLRKEIGYEAPYAIYIEYGTSPHFPPIKPIYDWAYRQRSNIDIKYDESDVVTLRDGNTYIKGILSFVYAVINKIGNEGTDAKPFLRPALQRGRDRTPEILRKHFEG